MIPPRWIQRAVFGAVITATGLTILSIVLHSAGAAQ